MGLVWPFSFTSLDDHRKNTVVPAGLPLPSRPLQEGRGGACCMGEGGEGAEATVWGFLKAL